MESTLQKRLGWSGAVVLIALFALVPVIWIISLSLKDPTTIGDGSFFPTKFTSANYSSIFKEPIFTDALRNSIGIALIATVIAVFLACFAAYAIARLNFPGKALILAASPSCPTSCTRRPRSTEPAPGSASGRSRSR